MCISPSWKSLKSWEIELKSWKMWVLVDKSLHNLSVKFDEITWKFATTTKCTTIYLVSPEKLTCKIWNDLLMILYSLKNAAKNLLHSEVAKIGVDTAQNWPRKGLKKRTTQRALLSSVGQRQHCRKPKYSSMRTRSPRNPSSGPAGVYFAAIIWKIDGCHQAIGKPAVTNCR